MSAVAQAEKRVHDLGSQIAQLRIKHRDAKAALLVAQAEHHGLKTGMLVRSTGRVHSGKTGRVVSFAESCRCERNNVERPRAVVRLLRVDGTYGDAHHEFDSWEIVT